VDLIPARKELSAFPEMIASKRFRDRTSVLRGPINSARKLYDFIFLDTPPSPGDLGTVAAYASADWFLLSVTPESLPIGSLIEAINDINEVREDVNKSLEVLGVLICCVKRTSKFWEQINELVAGFFPGRGFHSVISHSVEFQKAADEGVTLFQRKKTLNHKCTNEYREIAKEILKRVTNRQKFLDKARDLYRKQKVANG
jgi:chromosome partitioning protein